MQTLKSPVSMIDCYHRENQSTLNAHQDSTAHKTIGEEGASKNNPAM